MFEASQVQCGGACVSARSDHVFIGEDGKLVGGCLICQLRARIAELEGILKLLGPTADKWHTCLQCKEAAATYVYDDIYICTDCYKVIKEEYRSEYWKFDEHNLGPVVDAVRALRASIKKPK